MSTISKGQVDTSVIVGVVVVLAIISAAGFGIYYFGFIRPRQKQLQEAQESALMEVEDKLGTVNTSQAEEKTVTYKARIQEAETKSKVTDLVEGMMEIYERESIREELLTMVRDGTHGSFCTLGDLYKELRNKVTSKSELSQLEALRSTIEESLNNAWTDLHTQTVEDIQGEGIVEIKKNSLISESYMTKENAVEHIEGGTWEELQGLQFREKNTFMIPIIETFERATPIDPGDKVDIYEYNSAEETMAKRVQNTEVLNVVYPKDTISSISWNKNEGGSSSSYSTDVWSEIKAGIAGSGSASTEWNDWAQNVIQTARDDANIGDYSLEAIYVVEITEDNIAMDLTHIEQFQSGTKDLVLVSRK